MTDSLSRVMDVNAQPTITAEIMAMILSNLSDCKHLKLFCEDPRYNTIYVQHNVYRRFAEKQGWDTRVTKLHRVTI